MNSSGVLDLSTAYPEILLLVLGGESTEESLAEEIAELLRGCSFRVATVTDEIVTADVLQDFYQLIVVAGEDGGAGRLATFLGRASDRAPDLTHLAFGIITVHSGNGGDGTANTLIRWLDEHGAVEVIDRLSIGLRSDKRNSARAQYWSLDCVAGFSEAFAPVDSPAF